MKCVLAMLCAVLLGVLAGCGGEAPKAQVEPGMVDVAGMNAAMAFSTAENIRNHPEAFAGQRIRIRGRITVERDKANVQRFYVNVCDSNGCCNTFVEFQARTGGEAPREYWDNLNNYATLTGTLERGSRALLLVDEFRP